MVMMVMVVVMMMVMMVMVVVMMMVMMAMVMVVSEEEVGSEGLVEAVAEVLVETERSSVKMDQEGLVVDTVVVLGKEGLALEEGLVGLVTVGVEADSEVDLVPVVVLEEGLVGLALGMMT